MLSDVRTIQRGLDTSGVYTNEQIRDKLIPLLDHKNLVRLMDIQFEEIEQIHMAYPGFEDMTRGTLNRILFEKVYVMSPPPLSGFVPYIFLFFSIFFWVGDLGE